MNNIKLIVSDLDFTLLNKEFELTDYTRSVISKVLEKGVDFIPCSSRTIDEIPQWFKEQEKVHYIITSNGAAIFQNPGGNILRKNTLSKKNVLEILKEIDSINPYWTCAVEGVLYSNLKILDDREKLDMRGSYLRDVLSARRFVDGINFLENYNDDVSVEKIHLIINDEDPEQKNKVLNALKNFGEIAVSSSHPKNVEITNPEAIKGAALKWVMEDIGCTSEQIIACGDNDNDISMLRVANHRICVANATESVKNLANHYAGSHDEDGVAKMIDELLFNCE